MRRTPVVTTLLVIVYLAAIVAANLLVTHYGPSSVIYVAFLLVGFVLIVRNYFADIVGVRRFVMQAALILVGGLLTWLLNQDAETIAKASVIAFLVSESIEAVNYYLMRGWPWLERAPISATIGAAVDSVLFITIAFGWNFRLAYTQWLAKTAGGWLWSQVIATARKREVLPRNA